MCLTVFINSISKCILIRDVARAFKGGGGAVETKDTVVMAIYYTTVSKSVQIMPEMSTNVQRYLDS